MRVDKRTDGHGEANRLFPRLYESTQKLLHFLFRSGCTKSVVTVSFAVAVPNLLLQCLLQWLYQICCYSVFCSGCARSVVTVYFAVAVPNLLLQCLLQ